MTTNRNQVGDRALPYVSRKTLLTPGERRFLLNGLQPAVGDRYLISMKVRLADLLAVQRWESRHGRRIAQKHIDFVLATPKATRIVAAIELNDASHLEEDRHYRDQFVADALHAAGIPLIAFPIYRRYEPQKIAHHIYATVRHHRGRLT